MQTRHQNNCMRIYGQVSEDPKGSRATHHQRFGSQNEGEQNSHKYIEGEGFITQVFTMRETRARKESIRERECRRERDRVYPVSFDACIVFECADELQRPTSTTSTSDQATA